LSSADPGNFDPADAMHFTDEANLRVSKALLAEIHKQTSRTAND
jgi:hypothetical protein